jgi:hypothetical protein
VPNLILVTMKSIGDEFAAGKRFASSERTSF